ncbi:adenylyltransferase/cytidyltransferase family protein [Archaeoglobus veneficus]|uniref:FAD synthase n=1 Tax=Archaeoglobus veneficus (strain DSM 11195 / SNP6) TaxID=693661 RepID=F2KSG9_ARCVS|nr:adenylyltransferase/cytidyltransferase family protein [Archaeoglobus veneficus]AEA46938.1 cytidyltransferase-related domain protein [Archaeoglobus veneficus SNP6]
MVRVIATGTFDIIHPGHIRFLKEAKKLGDELIVIVAREKNVRHKPKPIIPEEQRRRVVEGIKYVDKAILGDEEDMFKPIMELKPDIIALGYDQHFNEKWLEEELRKRGLNTKVVRIAAKEECEFCSSTKIIKRVAEIAKKRVEEYEARLAAMAEKSEVKKEVV